LIVNRSLVKIVDLCAESIAKAAQSWLIRSRHCSQDLGRGRRKRVNKDELRVIAYGHVEQQHRQTDQTRLITGHRRIRRAQRWLESRAAAEEVLIVGATLDAANQLAREVAKKKGAAFGWHRLTLPQSAFAIAAPILAARGLTPLSRIGAGALVARLVHRMNAEGRLKHYQSVAMTPGFPRAVAGVIAELRLARISRGAIAGCAPDLEPLAEAYEAELKEAGLTDWPGVLALASEAASAVGGLIMRKTRGRGQGAGRISGQDFRT
jgi:hypothetical protein